MERYAVSWMECNRCTRVVDAKNAEDALRICQDGGRDAADTCVYEGAKDWEIVRDSR